MKKALRMAVLTVPFLVLAAQAAQPQTSTRASEQALLRLANGERAAQGLAPLKWSAPLAGAAHDHALLLAQKNKLSHQLPGEPGLVERASRFGALFSIIAENVAEGPGAEKIHEQWMNSPPHRANLLNPKLNSVGIALENRDGILFAVEDFSRATGELSVPEQEGIVSSQLKNRGLKLLDKTTDARRACSLDSGYAGNISPSFVVHYATPDLQSLPNLLDQRIQTGEYHSAVVGACQGDAKSGFSEYRVAVMLYK
jgi:hypothetical protein